MNRIRVLDPGVAARIAAGEVVERPVSVVRELIDNALDAGATRVHIEIEDGGIGLIRISDDGHGIPPEQVELAFERHATSKLTDLEGLSTLGTLGFRGEALPSIAAAADLEMLTRHRDEPIGVQSWLVDARQVRRQASPAPVGTTISVRELFGRLPARRKFLGSAPGEARQVTVLVTHYALAYPGVAFSFVSGGRQALTTPGDGNLRHAFAAIYGPGTAAEMLDVAYRDDAAAISGLAGPPSVHRGTRQAVSVFVNGRWVQSRTLTFAITDAYQTQLPVGRFPVACIDVHIEPGELDVNVHPAKAEVRFHDERAVARAVRRAVMNALEGAGVGEWEPASDSTPAPEGRMPLRQRLAVPQPVPSVFNAEAGASQPRLSFAPGAPSAGAPAQAPGHREVLPLLRLVGQLGLTYLVCEGPDGMYLVDQHAAHERVVYDRLLAKAPAGDGATLQRQPLLEPLLLDLDLAAVATIEQHGEQLATLGLELEPFGERACLVRAVPAGVGRDRDLASAIRALLEKLAGERRVSDPFARAAATVACHASVRAGMALAPEEMRQLLLDLERTSMPRTCAHGRPTVVRLGREAIERQFGR